MSLSFDSSEFRRILGHYPTGVCAITACCDGEPVGMVVGSFTSVSLDPPLVAFFPDRTSTSWPKIEQAGRFCVNILADDQHGVCRALASKGGNKFDQVSHRPSGAGLPIVEGSVAWVDCDLYAVHEAGDHYIVIGQVHSLEAAHDQKPLLFFQGGYGQFSPFAAIAV